MHKRACVIDCVRRDFPLPVPICSAAAIEAMRIIPEWAKCDVEEMVELACRVNVNAHGLRDESGSNYVMGVGMFPLTAMINHSCRPNSTFAYRGKRKKDMATKCTKLMPQASVRPNAKHAAKIRLMGRRFDSVSHVTLHKYSPVSLCSHVAGLVPGWSRRAKHWLVTT